MATTWGTGTTVPSQTTLEDTSRKVTCTDKNPAKVDSGHIALSSSTGSATRIVDMWHTAPASTYSGIRLAVFTKTTISYNETPYSFGAFNDFLTDNVDIHNFTDKTSTGPIVLSGSSSDHKVFAIHKAENPNSTTYINIGYNGSRNNTTSISAEYRRTYTVGYNVWCQYKQNRNIVDGLSGAHDYFAITVNAYNQFIVKQYPVYKGKKYTFNLYTQSQSNYDGIIISKAQLTDTNFTSLRNNSNTIAYCSGICVPSNNVNYIPTSDGYVYIYFKTDASILAGKRREQTGYKTIKITTSGSPGYQQQQVPIYEHYDLYTWGDVDITVTDIRITLSLNACGGSNGDARAYYQPGGAGTPETTIPSMTVQEDIMDTSVPTKWHSSLGEYYRFLGYYTSQIGGEQYFEPNGNCCHDIDFVEDTTLYAHWGNTIYNQGTWTNKTIYCTNGAYEASSTIGSKTVNIQADGTTGPNSIHSSNNITYSITDAATISNGFTISNDHRVTIRSGTPAGTYTVRFNIISPGQDGSQPGGYVDDGGYYYFPDIVSKTISIYILSNYAEFFGPISIDEYDYCSYLQNGDSLIPARLKQIIADNVNCNISDIHYDSHFVNDLGINSVEVVTLAQAIEDEYGITIDQSEFSYYDRVSVVVGVLEENGLINRSYPVGKEYVPKQHRNIPASEVSLYTSSWGNYFNIPTVYQLVQYSNRTRGYRVISEYIYKEESEFGPYVFNNLGTNVLSNNRVMFDTPTYTVQKRTYVTPEITNTILDYISQLAYDTGIFTSQTSATASPTDELDDYNLHSSTNRDGLINHICAIFDNTYGNLQPLLVQEWNDFVTIYDLIVFVQNNMNDNSLHYTAHPAFIMKRHSALRDRNVPTLTVTTPVGTTTLAPGATAYFNVKATYPSGSVENDVTGSCTITTSPTGKITII